MYSMFLDRKHFFNIFEKIKDFLKRDQRWRRQQWNLFASASGFLHDRGDMEFNRGYDDDNLSGASTPATQREDVGPELHLTRTGGPRLHVGPEPPLA